ncbi:transcriptional regulator, IclR family [Brevibacterium sp. 239c]|nr:transcriptional regulator, IclR family [Brevibacterium sp. 239c]
MCQRSQSGYEDRPPPIHPIRPHAIIANLAPGAAIGVRAVAAKGWVSTAERSRIDATFESGTDADSRGGPVCLSRHSSDLSRELPRVVGLPLPTAYHLLRALVFEGYLSKNEDGYLLGPAASQQQRASPQQRLPRIRPVLRSLRDELGGATYLSIYDHREIRLVDIADGPTAPAVDLWAGVHESGHATAFGKAILAGLTQDQRAVYIDRHDLFDLIPSTVTNRGALERSLNTTPTVWSDSEGYLLGTSCLATTISAGETVGAIAVPLPSHRPDTHDQALTLQRATRRLSRIMDASTA